MMGITGSDFSEPVIPIILRTDACRSGSEKFEFKGSFQNSGHLPQAHIQIRKREGPPQFGAS